MSKTLKQILLVSLMMVVGVTLASHIPMVFAQGFGTAADQPSAVAGATGGTGSIRELAVRIINYVLGFLGLIAVAMIIYGGVSYVTAAGEQSKVDNAKKVILYAIVGLVIVILSYAIVSTVLGAATGTAA